MRTDYTETQSGSESGLASSTLTRASAHSAPTPAAALDQRRPSPAHPRKASRPGVTCTRSPVRTTSGTPSRSRASSRSTRPRRPRRRSRCRIRAAVSTRAGPVPGSSRARQEASTWAPPRATVTPASPRTPSRPPVQWAPPGALPAAARRARTASWRARPSRERSPSTRRTVPVRARARTSTVSADSTAPTTTIQCNAAACFSGTYYTSAPVHVTLSADDGSGSGVQKIRYTTDGTNPSPVNGSDYSGTIDVASTTTIKFRAYDNPRQRGSRRVAGRPARRHASQPCR